MNKICGRVAQLVERWTPDSKTSKIQVQTPSGAQDKFVSFFESIFKLMNFLLIHFQNWELPDYPFSKSGIFCLSTFKLLFPADPLSKSGIFCLFTFKIQEIPVDLTFKTREFPVFFPFSKLKIFLFFTFKIKTSGIWGSAFSFAL